MTRRLTPDELQQVLELYRLGKSTYTLARQFGTDRHTITGHLRRGGVSLRSRQKLTPQLVEQAARLYAAGHSLATIGKQLSLSPMTVRKAVTSTGIPLRDRQGRPTEAMPRPVVSLQLIPRASDPYSFDE
jgi:DNA-binding CsgD family transcriptional regulator